MPIPPTQRVQPPRRQTHERRLSTPTLTRAPPSRTQDRGFTCAPDTVAATRRGKTRASTATRGSTPSMPRMLSANGAIRSVCAGCDNCGHQRDHESRVSMSCFKLGNLDHRCVQTAQKQRVSGSHDDESYRHLAEFIGRSEGGPELRASPGESGWSRTRSRPHPHHPAGSSAAQRLGHDARIIACRRRLTPSRR